MRKIVVAMGARRAYSQDIAKETETMTKTTYAQQAAAAARKMDYDNAAALYNRAAIEADFDGNSAKSKRLHENANKYQRMADRAA